MGLCKSVPSSSLKIFEENYAVLCALNDQHGSNYKASMDKKLSIKS